MRINYFNEIGRGNIRYTLEHYMENKKLISIQDGFGYLHGIITGIEDGHVSIACIKSFLLDNQLMEIGCLIDLTKFFVLRDKGSREKNREHVLSLLETG